MTRNFDQSQLSVNGEDIIPYDPASAKVPGTIGEAIRDILAQPKLSIIPTKLPGETTWDAAFARGFQAASDAGVAMLIPIGDHNVTQAQQTLGVKVIGYGNGSVVSVPQTFNLSAQGVFVIPGSSGETKTGISNLKIKFDQPTTGTRLTAIQYPPAVYCVGVTRMLFNNLTIEGSWDGINATGNTGGSEFNVDIGALNRGLQIDGALDFVRGSLRFWPYGFQSGTALGDAYRDGNTVGLYMGSCDGVALSGVDTFVAKIVFYSGANGPAFGSIGHIHLDGQRSCIEGVARLEVGTWYKSSALADDKAMRLTGERWDFGPGRCSMASTGTAAAIQVAGAQATFGPISFPSGSPDARLVNVETGGVATLIAPRVLFGTNTSRSAPFFGSTGSGVLGLLDAELPNIGTGSGQCVALAQDVSHNIRIHRDGTWPVGWPPTTINGTYSFGQTFTSVPVPIFATMGDAVFTPSGVMDVAYKVKNSICTARVEMNFDTNAYTTTSGLFLTNVNMAVKPIKDWGGVMSEQANVTFSGSFSPVLQTSGQMRVRLSASNAALSNYTTANVLPSKTGIRMVANLSFPI